MTMAMLFTSNTDPTNAKEFYASKEWADLKKKVYKRYGRRCMATGLTEEDGITLSVDKIYPRSDYPHLALKMSNMQVIELGLNKTKGKRIIKDWRPLKWRIYYFIIRLAKALGVTLILLLTLFLVGQASYPSLFAPYQSDFQRTFLSYVDQALEWGQRNYPL